MKRSYLIIRIILIVLFGVGLTYKTIQFRYSDFVLDSILYLILIIIGSILWGWFIYKDLKYFIKEKKYKYLLTTIIGLVFIVTIAIINFSNNYQFNKPTLIKVYYDGDFNGTSIDFKTDGTYIFENSAIGLSDYEYGKYQISGNKITLDKIDIDNVIKTNKLEICAKAIDDTDSLKKEDYLLQVNTKGKILDREIEFRVTVDNRKK